VLLRRQITQVTGTDPLAREGLLRWTAGVMDVYTRGVFTVPAEPDETASDQWPAREQRY
jgi:hypothetical protein